MCSACCRSSSTLLPSSPCSRTSSLSPPRTMPAEDRELSNYSFKLPNRRPEVKEVLERRSLFKYFLLIITMIVTDMVNGDGTLTPCISVLSTVGGIKEATDFIKQDGLHWPMFVVATLSAIMASQAMISGTFSIIQQSLALGCFLRVKIIHTLSKYEGQLCICEVNYALTLACVAVTFSFRDIVKIGNPYWVEALFADVGHFTVQSIQITMCSVAFSSLILAYAGQA
ncbi:hypothetical protein Cni_G20695 [Canna indica]|uniref:K+ potassium transporter integral membrane domain-containing protein n=1 Tax=Canna indica TaxID=4628 RepID=A0AAQ3QGH5_9LILI|nr:hypothetical protein Cni_G20695 [Canna indica]